MRPMLSPHCCNPRGTVMRVSRTPARLLLSLIALTANSEHPGRELAREVGIDRYLIKPVHSAYLDELLTLIH